jgi:hypothetical protein
MYQSENGNSDKSSLDYLFYDCTYYRQYDEVPYLKVCLTIQLDRIYHTYFLLNSQQLNAF